MKKVMLILALGLAAVQLSQAQSSDKPGGFGVRGGASLFNFGGDDVSENSYTNRVGFHVGGYAMLFMTDRLALEPGVYYSVKGTQNDDFIDSRAILNYVDVPVLLRLYPSDGFNVFLGPQISFLANSKFEGDFFGNTVSYDSDAIKETDFGLVFGLGYNLPKGFNVQASYDYGVTPIFKDSDADVYNRGFKLSAGYTF
ncbi:PorT family protein [Algoriphagus sp. AGSA1]|uniref:porin family protein n=1 Tax=Algoriphagus sp. AGSA1 TaxID=2907213 RepID=UPI001F42223B|nr:porin family protein [Algoriphagus sp. AGSA1]MCE7054941.1 PorT family protein [Algoriphagus sp. AGSA1]